jgi:uncharacterized protein (TIGR02646 family)
MKYIDKGPEPEILLKWKAKDKMYLRGKPNWNRLDKGIKDVLRITIAEEQGYICCYCERRLNDVDYHIEHIKPKAKGKYPELQLEYDNMLCSCQLKLKYGEPRHCARAKDNWFQENNFVSPLNPLCESKFTYTYDGYISPTDEHDNAAITTIDRLKLGIDKLNALRRNAIAPFIDEDIDADELTEFVTRYLVDKDENGGTFNEFYSTIKYLFGN